MKTTIKQGRTRITVRAPCVTNEYIRTIGLPRFEASALAQDEQWRLDRRVAEVTAALAKCTGKARKPTLSKGKREYPEYGDHLSTHAYVAQYCALNEEVFKLTNELSFYQPMTKHITVPVGEDSNDSL